MRGYIVPVCAGVLPAIRVRREGVALYIDTALAHCVLPATGRDHTADVPYRAAAGQIPTIYHGPGHVVRIRHRGSPERQFQVNAHTSIKFNIIVKLYNYYCETQWNKHFTCMMHQNCLYVTPFYTS